MGKMGIIGKSEEKRGNREVGKCGERITGKSVEKRGSGEKWGKKGKWEKVVVLDKVE